MHVGKSTNYEKIKMTINSRVNILMVIITWKEKVTFEISGNVVGKLKGNSLLTYNLTFQWQFGVLWT